MQGVLDCSASSLKKGILDSHYWSYETQSSVELGWIEHFVFWLFGDCLGMTDTCTQKCAYRTFKAIKRAAEQAEPPLNQRPLALEWTANIHMENEWSELLQLATKKTSQIYRSHFISLFTAPIESREETFNDSEYTNLFNILAPPLEEKTEHNFTDFFIDLLDQGKKNPYFFLPNECKAEKTLLLGRYALSLKNMVTFKKYFPPLIELKTHLLRIMTICLQEGPLLTAGLKLKHDNSKIELKCNDSDDDSKFKRPLTLWDTFFPELITTISWYDPALFSDPRIVNGFLHSLGLQRDSDLFKECKSDVKEIEKMRNQGYEESVYTQMLWQKLITKLIEREI